MINHECFAFRKSLLISLLKYNLCLTLVWARNFHNVHHWVGLHDFPKQLASIALKGSPKPPQLCSTAETLLRNEKFTDSTNCSEYRAVSSNLQSENEFVWEKTFKKDFSSIFTSWIEIDRHTFYIASVHGAVKSSADSNRLIAAWSAFFFILFRRSKTQHTTTARRVWESENFKVDWVRLDHCGARFVAQQHAVPPTSTIARPKKENKSPKISLSIFIISGSSSERQSMVHDHIVVSESTTKTTKHFKLRIFLPPPSAVVD